MRKLEEIYDEIVEECLKNNCQSYRAIAIVAMEKAIEEYKSYREDLEDFSKQMKSIDSNMAQVINDKFWELLDD